MVTFSYEKKMSSYSSKVICGMFWVSPKTQLQAYPLKHTIS